MSGENRVSGLKRLGESAVNTVLDRVGRGVGTIQERRPLAYDLLESDDAYLVVFDTPGVANTDVQVQFREGAVEVQVDRFRDFYEGFEMRFPGRGLSLDGRAELPGDATVDPRTAEATLTEHGTLEVRVPKDEGAVAVSSADADTDDNEPIQLDPDADAEPGHEEDDHEANEDDTHETAATHDDADQTGETHDDAHDTSETQDAGDDETDDTSDRG